MKKGENGKGIASRWYPTTLAKRIRDIVALKKSISFSCADGIGMIQAHSKQANVVFFIDPPYTVAGRRLYRFSEINHVKLFEVAAEAVGDCLMTYDACEEVELLAKRLGFQTALIAMKTTHHKLKQELLVGKNLDWLAVD